MLPEYDRVSNPQDVETPAKENGGAFAWGNTCSEALREFIAEAKQLDTKSMQYILGIMKELNSRK